MRNRTFLRYIISYALVLILPFLSVYFIFNSEIIRRYSEESAEQDNSMLVQLRETLDTDLQQLFNLSYVIQNTSSLNPKNIGENVISRRAAVSVLSTYNSITTLPETVIIYRSGDGICYTSTTAISPEKLFGQQAVYTNHTVQDFLTAVDDPASVVLWPEDAVHMYGGQTADYVTLFVSVGAGNVRPKQRSVFLIPVRKLEDRILSLSSRDASVTVTDRNGAVLFSVGKDIPGLQAGEPLADEGSCILDGRNYAVLKTASRITGWVYTVLRPTDTLEGPLRTYRRNATVLLILVLLIGGAVIYAVSWRSYKPIRNLAEKARSYKPETRPGNEMEQVESVLESLSDESNAYRATLESSTDKLRQNCLTRILSGADRDGNLTAELRSYGSLTDPDAPCRVAVMEKQGLHRESAPDFIAWELMAVSLGITDAVVCENPPDSDLIAVVFQYIGKTEECDGELMTFRTRMEDETGLPVSVGVSADKPVSCLREAYLQAVRSYRTRLVRGKGNVYFESAEPEAAASVKDYPLQQLEALQWHLLQLDVDNARQCLRNITAALQKKPVSVSLARMVCSDTVNVTLRTLISMKDKVNPELSAELLEQLVSFDSVQELTGLLENLIDKTISAVGDPDSGETERRVAAMKEYIGEHCFSGDFSLQMIADHFGLTPSNFSHYFKSCVGIGLSEYVQELRKNEACRLLTETDLSVQEIGCRIGMVNVSSFIRFFKQMTGLTPGQYRKT